MAALLRTEAEEATGEAAEALIQATAVEELVAATRTVIRTSLHQDSKGTAIHGAAVLAMEEAVTTTLTTMDEPVVATRHTRPDSKAPTVHLGLILVSAPLWYCWISVHVTSEKVSTVGEL